MARPRKDQSAPLEAQAETTPEGTEVVGAEAPVVEQAEQPVRRVTRATRVPVSGPRDILTVTFKDPNYFYRWVKDLPGRLQRFEAAGYNVVTDADTTVGQRTVDSASRLGSAVTRKDGSNTLVLMRIPLEWYNEDQESKQRELDALEDTLKADGLRHITRDSTWQPNSGEMYGVKAK